MKVGNSRMTLQIEAGVPEFEAHEVRLLVAHDSWSTPRWGQNQ
jgi:hypothetical protein